MHEDLRELSDVELSDFIAQCHAGENTLRRRRLAAMAVYAEREAYRGDGAPTMASWAAAHLGQSPDTAGEEVRVSEAFVTLPKLAATFADGKISWDVARTATRFVTAETDEHLAEQLPRFTAREVRRMARRLEPVSTAEAAEAIEQRSLRMRWDIERSRLHIRGVLPAAEGALVENAISFVAARTMRNITPLPAGGTTYDQARADALVHLCSQNVNASGEGPRPHLSLHIDGDILYDLPGACEIECGPPVSVETARRIVCDAAFNLVVNGDDGLPVGIGRTSRIVPPHIAREVRDRDGGCRWRGCDRKGWINIHHLVHWFDGGPTDPDNLIMLCWHHHRMVHEGRWRIEGDPYGELFFISPDGRVFPEGPTPLRRDVKERLEELVGSATGAEGPSP
jgi:hypothetical protein